jgi:hypothetical protein
MNVKWLFLIAITFFGIGAVHAGANYDHDLCKDLLRDGVKD